MVVFSLIFLLFYFVIVPIAFFVGIPFIFLEIGRQKARNIAKRDTKVCHAKVISLTPYKLYGGILGEYYDCVFEKENGDYVYARCSQEIPIYEGEEGELRYVVVTPQKTIVLSFGCYTDPQYR